MNILVTGAKGFVGRNLVENLKNIKDGKDRTRTLQIDAIYEYDQNNTKEDLQAFCTTADVVFHLAGVNRPEHPSEYMEGNFGLSSLLLETLKEAGNRCPVMLSSSIQASLTGRFEGSEYGKSKLEGEKLFFDYQQETGAVVWVYRFPNLFGKWCRPNYNSAVATFCHNIANDLPITVNDPSVELELLYIDDLVNALLDTLEGNEQRCDYEGIYPVLNPQGKYCYVRETHHVTLGRITEILETFRSFPETGIMPELRPGSFEKKLFSTYLSYLPKTKMRYDLHPAVDHRGSFTEVLKTISHGQVSINVSKPGMTKGQHWHNTKWEIFVVVHGHGLIQERRIGSDEVVEFEVNGDHPEAVIMIPGYTHNIINLSDTEDMITLMWANEIFDPSHPETYREEV